MKLIIEWQTKTIKDVMKILSKLPPKHFYKPIPSKTEDIYLFEDQNTKALVIRSPIPDPFDQKWTILFSPQKQKSDKSEYPYRLVLRLYPIDNTVEPTLIIREKIKGVFANSREITLAFFAFPIGEKIWIVYSIVPSKKIK